LTKSKVRREQFKSENLIKVYKPIFWVLEILLLRQIYKLLQK